MLRKNARMYIHGHSAGGTNPSLVEAMFFGCPILAYDVVYNRETTFGQAYYYNNAEELTKLINSNVLDGAPMKRLAKEEYTWKLQASTRLFTKIVQIYENRLRNSVACFR